MQITTYRELRSKDELLPLMGQAFWWAFNPKEFEKTIKADPRLQNSPVGYAAIKNNNLAGLVGVMDIRTRTLDGTEETVGGIWGVATYPAYARKGISTALMKKSHEYFKGKDYRFSFLNAGRPSIAYAFYQKLGYKEVIVYPSAYKLIKKPKKPARKTAEKTKLDWNKILKIYNEATKNRTGPVIRDKQCGRMLETGKRFQPKKSILIDKGYALLKEEKGNITIQEIIALTTEEISKLLNQIEERANKTVIDRIVLDENLQDAYRSHGYMVLKESHEVLMAKPLTKSATFTEVYGNKFYTSSADSF